jgi:hypothetical protein
MIKNTALAGTNWEIIDTARDEYNPESKYLNANLSDAENNATGFPRDYLSNGFKMRNTGSGGNSSGTTYIYMAFAENPFKYANAR